MGGELNMSGEFTAEATKKPVYDLKLSLVKMRYEEVYRQVISFQYLAPIAKFLNGFFNADFSFKGSLNEDMSPQLESDKCSRTDTDY